MDLAALLIPAVRLAVLSSGAFFLSALLTGVWKYAHIARSASAAAPVYVDIAHRTSLLYSFAALLLAQFAALSAWSNTVNLVATAIPLAFFAGAIGGYAIHGFLNDTDNQFRKPQRVGPVALPRGALAAFMWLLALGEIGGFAVLFAGTLRSLGYV